MTVIKASCPMCGEVDLTAADITLMVCSHASLSYYEFGCPTCLDDVRKPACDRAISLLLSGGVQATVWEVPEEAFEAHIGPTLTRDDLLDLVLALDRADDPAGAALEELVHR